MAGIRSDTSRDENGNLIDTDFDPESIFPEYSTSESDQSNEDPDNRRAHYEELEKSRIRPPQVKNLPARYSGAEISRDLLTRDELDDVEEETDSEDDKTRLSEPSITASDGLRQDKNGNSERVNHAGIQIKQGDDADRAALQAIVRQASSNAIQELRATAQADLSKGIAVRKQKSTFNTLLDLRIRLQKSLVAANSVDAIPKTETMSSDDRTVLAAAESAALQLINTIDNLRHAFQHQLEQADSRKRPFSEISGLSLDRIHAIIALTERNSGQTRHVNLNKWAKRTSPTDTRVRVDKLRTESNQPSLTDLLNTQLDISSVARLIARSRIARSCAPLQAAVDQPGDKEVYDDGDWYSQLLRELVESKLASSSTASIRAKSHVSLNTIQLLQMQRDAKARRLNVDVKASKGRKLKFTVQEKLQNFMAPDDRTTWGEMQTRDLFSSLAGQRKLAKLYSTGTKDEGQDAMDNEGNRADALPLFSMNGMNPV